MDASNRFWLPHKHQEKLGKSGFKEQLMLLDNLYGCLRYAVISVHYMSVETDAKELNRHLVDFCRTLRTKMSSI